MDGLRAVAVLSVALHHAGIAIFSGGYVGVDVFFVISGYLITRIIRDELEAETFRLARFYERRIRRIFPALLVVAGACTATACLLLTPNDLEQFGRSLAHAAAFASNLFFWSEIGYFADPAEEMALLHTWSLAIEEQFYLVWPLLLPWAVRLGPGPLAGLAALSFGACVWATPRMPDAAFYLTPFRAWELAAGALLTWAGPWTSVRLRRLSSSAGLTAIGAGVVLLEPGSAFPGFVALLPVAGAAAVILAGSSPILELRPMVHLGRLSYSFYLWHWPLLAFARYRALRPLETWETSALLLGSLGLAALSHRFVETPFRERAWPTGGVLFAGGAAAAAAACVGLALADAGGIPARFDPGQRQLLSMLDKHTWYSEYDRGGCFLDYHQTFRDWPSDSCLSGLREPGRARVLIFGDSFAAHYFGGLKRIQRAAGRFRVAQVTATSCRPVSLAVTERCTRFYHWMMESLLPSLGHVDAVIVSGLWSNFVGKFDEAVFDAALGRSLRHLAGNADTVILIGQSPTFGFRVPMAFLFDEAQQDARLPADDHRPLNDRLAGIAAKSGALFFDPYRLICAGTGCSAARDGGPLFWDFGHLTAQGSSALAAELAQLLPGSH